MTDFHFVLTEDETQLILNSAIHRPYVEVVQLIAKLQDQVKPQLTEDCMTEFHFVLTEAETNLVLNSVVQRPYAEVAQLMAKLQDQIKPQLTKPTTAPLPAD